jgi:hypothetical protein
MRSTFPAQLNILHLTARLCSFYGSMK